MLLAQVFFFPPKKHVAVVPETGKDLLLASQVWCLTEPFQYRISDCLRPFV